MKFNRETKTYHVFMTATVIAHCNLRIEAKTQREAHRIARKRIIAAHVGARLCLDWYDNNGLSVLIAPAPKAVTIHK